MAGVDVRGPARYLWWLARQLKGAVALGAMFGSLWFVSLAFTPYLISQAIDRGLQPAPPGRADRLGRGRAGASAWPAPGSASCGTARMTKLRLAAALRTADLVMTHATRLGAALPRRITAGEVVTIGISDVWTIGRAMNVGGRRGGARRSRTSWSRSCCSRTSPTAGRGRAGRRAGARAGRRAAAAAAPSGPALRYRERQGELNARLVDVLGGLRILNGLGGKDTHLARYRRGVGRRCATRATGSAGRPAGSARSATACRWCSSPW